MKKFVKNKKTWYIVIIVLLVLVSFGCSKITDKDGMILPDKIITLKTTYKMIENSEGWFQAVFVYPLAQLINYLTPMLTVVGAIIAVTVLVNLITFVFSVKSAVSSQKMQMIQPELKKIQEKYEGRNDQESRAALGREMTATYSKHGISFVGALLVPFLQLPIILAMYQAVQRAEAVVSGEIFGCKLINSPMFGIKNGEIALFVIYVLMAIAQFGSTRLPQYLAKKRAEKNRKGRPDDNSGDSANSMVFGMLALILYLAINWPTAMSLYWLVSSMVNIVKTYYIQRRYIDNEKV